MPRLDRLITAATGLGGRALRQTLRRGAVAVGGQTITEPGHPVGPFERVELDGKPLQQRIPRYLMLNKPAGIVSATSDSEHETVVDLIDEPWRTELHLAGRLDRFTTGLVILTNDSRFSETITEPRQRVPKRYLVTTDKEITSEAVAAFENGMPFEKEGITTAPAEVTLTDPKQCLLTIFEGKHHQVKRMFARFDIKVTELHRDRVGPFVLDDQLKAGEYRPIPASRVAAFLSQQADD